MWKALNAAIPILAGAPGAFSIGPCVFSKGRISLPNGLYLHYHNLRNTPDGWVYDHAESLGGCTVVHSSKISCKPSLDASSWMLRSASLRD